MKRGETSKLKQFVQEAISLSERKSLYKKDIEILSYEIKDDEIIKVKAQDINSKTIYTCEINSCGYPAVSECDDSKVRELFRQKLENALKKGKKAGAEV